ncbi:MAG: methionyl-tRNA formyltransferase [Bacteroidales bacterium]|nr:methionyl-tRNA formyltransferase [Bacteroidales bacterium]
MRKARIIFMGTPEFAVGSLSTLINNNKEVVAVVTVPDKPAGRGLKLRESAVKQFALSQQLPVLQPVSLKDPDFIEELKSYNANLFVVVAFRKLPDEVWSLPGSGTFNLHASLLPDYRGAAPINHAVINGESVTGVTTFFLNSEIDTGRIILSRSLEIGPDETAGELHDRLMVTGAELTLETVNAIEMDSFTLKEQPKTTNPLKGAPRIFRKDCQINWNEPALKVHNLIRGLSPYPGAFSAMHTTNVDGEVKIIRSAISSFKGMLTPGEAVIHDNRITVACAQGFIEILQLQPAGKKAMETADFLRGLRSAQIRFS